MSLSVTINPHPTDANSDREAIAKEFGITQRYLREFLSLAKLSEDFLEHCVIEGDRVSIPRRLTPFQVDFLRTMLQHRHWGKGRIREYILSDGCKWTYSAWRQTQQSTNKQQVA